MKILCKKYLLKRWSFGISLMLVIFSTTLVLAQEKPPAPKEPVSNLQMPQSVKVSDLKGRAVLPEQTRLGFGLDLDDKILGGNWDVKGRVTSVEPGKLAFTTGQGETGNLVYRLPEGVPLSLSADEPVSINRTTIGYKAAMGYNLVVGSTDRLVINSGLLIGELPQKVQIGDGFTLEQDKQSGRVLIKGKYETIYQVAVNLVTDDGKIQLTTDEMHEVTVRGKTYNVMIYQSSRVVPTKEYQGLAESSGYALEYMLVPK